VSELLPPAIEEFVADASKWVAGIDEMIASNERLMASIAEVQDLARASTEATAGAVSAGGIATGAADTTAASEAATAAATEQAAAQEELSTAAMQTVAAETDLTSAEWLLVDGLARAIDAASEAAAAEARLAAGAQAAGEATTEAAAGAERAGAAAAAAAEEQRALAASAAEAAAAESKLAEAEALEADMAKSALEVQAALRDAHIASARAAATSAKAQQTLAADERLTRDMANEEAAANERNAGAMAGLGSATKLAIAGVAVAVGYSIDKAMKFQAAVTQLYTAAHLTGISMAALSQKILQIGYQTGESGTAIATALYHPISAGLSLSNSLATVANSAKLAQIHGADLEDTTYALSSVMKAFNLNTSDAAKTAGLLNAIVGQGDMRFQNFNQSIKNWAPTAAAMGISIRSMGAALAYLTDRGNTAETASTRLTMGLSMVTSGSKEANTFLRSLGLATDNITLKNKSLADVMNSYGLTVNKIATDLRKPDGIYIALSDMEKAFKASGLSAAQASQVMAKLFGGGRSDKAMLSLMSNLDNIRTKYEGIGKAVSGYGKSWSETEKTAHFAWTQFLADVENLVITFGTKLLPIFTKVVRAVDKFMEFISHHEKMAAFAGAVIAIAVGVELVTASVEGLGAVLSANPVGVAIIAIGALALGLYELYEHSKLVRDIVHDVANAFKSAWAVAMRAAGAVIDWFVHGPLVFVKQQIAAFRVWWEQNHKEIEEVARVVWAVVSFIVKTYLAEIIATIKIDLAVIKAAWTIAWGLIRDTVKLVWDTVAALIRAELAIIRDAIALFLDIITGHWAKAWTDLKKLTSDEIHGILNVMRTIFNGAVTLLYDLAKNLIMGFVHGITASLGAVRDAAGSIGSAAISSIKSVLGISSPSKVMQNIAVEIGNGIVAGLEGTASKVKSAAGKLVTYIKEAFDAGDISSQTESNVTKWIEADNNKLQALATKRSAIMSTISKAKTFATNTASSVAGTFDLVSAAGSGPITSQNILANLQADLSQINQFKSAIGQLSKLGLNKDYINQIIQAGPVQGLAIAKALLQVPGNIKAINKAESGITSASKSLGQTAANAMYDSGAQAGKGFLSGLEAQEKAITKEMTKIAKGMVSQIKKDLGIKSPSTVMYQHGMMVSQGLAQGIIAGLPHVTAAMRALSSATAPGTVHPATGVALAASQGAGGFGVTSSQQTLNLTLKMQWPTGSNLQATDQKYTLRYNRRNGTNGLTLATK